MKRIFFISLICLFLICFRASVAENARILTLNVLAEPVAKEKRVKAIHELGQREKPDVIYFQETSRWFTEEIAKLDFFKSYQVNQKKGHYTVIAGLMIAIRNDFAKMEEIRYSPLPSRQRRCFLIQKINIEGIGTVAVATAHLESFLEDIELRCKQLEFSFQKLAPYQRVIYGADFNFGDDGKSELLKIPELFQDAWKSIKPQDVGFTWNREKSIMAKNGSYPNEESRRIDHIYIKGDHQVTEAKVVGDQEIEPGLFPSDHFGVIVNFQWKKDGGRV